LSGVLLLVLTFISGNLHALNPDNYEFYEDGTYDLYNDAGKLIATQIPCPNTEPLAAATDLHLIWEQCIYQERLDFGYYFFYKSGASGPVAPNAWYAGEARPASGNGANLVLGSATPVLPFLGNQFAVISAVPNAPTFGNLTATYSVGLRRQSDCSLNEDFVLPGQPGPNAGIISTLPGAEIYFHNLAGLTTTPDVFAHGCAYPVLGQPSDTGLILQPTSDGGTISAGVSGSLYVFVLDPVADRITNTILLSGNANPSLGAIAAAQLTSSGNMDIVATFATDPANQQLATAVFLGNGDGTFKPATYYDVAGDITIADVNGDGKPDIVICGLTPGITTLKGNGNGGFTASALSAASIRPCGEAAGQVMTGAFHTGGHTDLLVAGTVLAGNGDGTFSVGAPVTADATFNFSSSIPAVAVGDINNDGKADVVISQPGFVALFYGNGNGTFSAGPRYAAPVDYMPVSITDLDGDGNADIVLGVSSGGIFTAGCCVELQQPPFFQILMGRGDGTFVDSLAYDQGSFGNGGNSVAGPQIAVGDFNADGRNDVLVFNGSTLQLLPGDNTGALGSAVTTSLNVSPGMIIGADMNRDGKPDAVLAGRNLSGPALAVLTNKGNGTFAGEQDYSLPNPAVSIVTGDFNGDGRMDVAVGIAAGFGGSGPSGVYVLFGQSNGTLGSPVKMDSSLNPTGLAAGDLDGDGRADLIVADQGFFDYAGSPNQINGALHVYLGNANSTFTAKPAPATVATNYSVAVLGDLNGDGKLDLVVGGNIVGLQDTSTPGIYTFLGNGDGTFKAANSTALPGNYGIGTTGIALADFNHDGHLDVAAADATAFTSILLGNGDGSLSPALLTLGQQPAAIAATDLNGDSFPELLVGTTSGGAGGVSLDVFLNSNRWPALATEPGYGAGQLTLPIVSVGGASFTDMVITVGKIVSGPTGTSAESSGNSYDPSTGQLSVSQVSFNGTTFHNVVITVAGLVSVAQVDGADTYDGSYLQISSVQVGGTVYDNVIVTLGQLIHVAGGMPGAVRDQYNAATRQLLIPAVEFNGHVYTNVTVTVGSVISVGP
jgi:hypothetical protein